MAYWLIPSPAIRRTIPQKNENTFSPTEKVEIVFDRPISRSILEKSILPETPGRWVFENSLYTTHLYRRLVFYPTYSLRPNTTYTVKLSGIRNLLKVSSPYEHQYSFTTQPAPKILTVSPSSELHDVDPTAKIKVTLDRPNARISEFEFKFTPQIEYDTILDASNTIYTLTPKAPLAPGTEYKLKVQKTDNILNLEDGQIVERGAPSVEYDGLFVTRPDLTGGSNASKGQSSPSGPVVVTITPENGWSAVSVRTPIKITFDQAVDRASAQQKFSISPQVAGDFNWEGDTLSFTPQNPFAFTTAYTVTLVKGVKAATGRESQQEFRSEFSTQNTTTKLAVPAYLQKYTLSCEIASLRMALNFRRANVTEDDLIPQVGLDTTPHSGNVWGNPYNAFVGNIRGTQMKDGYGVYWGPIAKAARNYRQAQEFSGWKIEQLTGAIASNNPVIIWVYSHFGTPTSWKTPDGTDIYAVRDEHAVVAVGFVGPATNPSQIIINDPLSGQVYWSRSSFDKKWNIFGNSGVVIY